MTAWHLIAIAFAIPFAIMLWQFIVHVTETHRPRRKTKGQQLADETRAKQADALQERGFKYGDTRDVIDG